jgi:hypothetical protein
MGVMICLLIAYDFMDSIAFSQNDQTESGNDTIEN